MHEPTLKKRAGASIILVNGSRQVLLMLRDDKPEICCPDMWDLPGGHVEPGETPLGCIIREMLEEIETDVTKCRPWSRYDFPDRIEYIFEMAYERPAEQIPLHEGQRLRWFHSHELEGLELAFGFDTVLDDYFNGAGRTGSVAPDLPD